MSTNNQGSTDQLIPDDQEFLRQQITEGVTERYREMGGGEIGSRQVLATIGEMAKQLAHVWSDFCSLKDQADDAAMVRKRAKDFILDGSELLALGLAAVAEAVRGLSPRGALADPPDYPIGETFVEVLEGREVLRTEEEDRRTDEVLLQLIVREDKLFASRLAGRLADKLAILSNDRAVAAFSANLLEMEIEKALQERREHGVSVGEEGGQP